MNCDSEKYHLLIENLPDAFAYHQVVIDDDGTPADYIFLEVSGTLGTGHFVPLIRIACNGFGTK